MAFVTDPDNLDRFQVAVDPVNERISIRGLGTTRGLQQNTGESDGTETFIDATNGNFVTDGVVQGDILTVVSGDGIGHYEIVSVSDESTIVVEKIINGTGTNLTYKIHAPAAQGSVDENVADGVSMQAVYSFLKEEWREM